MSGLALDVSRPNLPPRKEPNDWQISNARVGQDQVRVNSLNNICDIFHLAFSRDGL